MSVNLTVASTISTQLQTVTDQNNAASALRVASNGTAIVGQDVVGSALPLQITGQAPPTGQQTWGRLLRLMGINGTFFDLGIDDHGNLFINTPSSSATAHALTISPAGVVTIGSLTTPPAGVATVGVVVDPLTGKLYKQA